MKTLKRKAGLGNLTVGNVIIGTATVGNVAVGTVSVGTVTVGHVAVDTVTVDTITVGKMFPLAMLPLALILWILKYLSGILPPISPASHSPRWLLSTSMARWWIFARSSRR